MRGHTWADSRTGRGRKFLRGLGRKLHPRVKERAVRVGLREYKVSSQWAVLKSCEISSMLHCLFGGEGENILKLKPGGKKMPGF